MGPEPFTVMADSRIWYSVPRTRPAIVYSRRAPSVVAVEPDDPELIGRRLLPVFGLYRIL